MTAWVAPETFVSGEVLTAAELNVNVRDNTLYAKEALDRLLLTSTVSPPRARVYNSANILLTTAVEAALTFDTENYDVGTLHSTSSNTSRITIPAGYGGVYHIGGMGVFAAHATGYRQLYVKLNGTTNIGDILVTENDGTDSTRMMLSFDYALAATNYIELFALQTCGTNMNVVAQAGGPAFWVHFLGA